MNYFLKRFFWAAFAVLALSGLVFAQVPAPQGRVNDFAGVISAEYRDKISALIDEVEQKTSAEIAVVTQESIAPYGADTYAQMIFDSWKIGKKGKDSGVLILLAVKEREWRIHTGYGLEGILPDGVCGQIGRNYLVPYFKEGKYSEGLYYGVAAVADIIGKDAKISLSGLSGVELRKQQDDALAFMPFFMFFFFLIWNLPWPVFIGLPFTLFFALAFSAESPLLGAAVIAGYVCSMVIRYNYWSRLPENKKGRFWGPMNYGNTSGGGYQSGGFGGGSFGGGGFGGGGFGGGSSGGGGAGGRF